MARPTTMQVTDLVKQAVFRIEREITAENNKPFNPVEKLSVVSTGVGAAVSWFFPQQIQRTIFGWCIVVLMIGLVLRLVFGIHLEEIGRLVVKWALG